MANSGPNSNGCQFFITCAPAPHLGKIMEHGTMGVEFLYISLILSTILYFFSFLNFHYHFCFLLFVDGKHTVFGKVLDDMSMLTVRKCEAVPVSGSTPRIPLRITQCGEL
jgi:peptidyl-prolyl isomerase H (cyclophilin H)